MGQMTNRNKKPKEKKERSSFSILFSIIVILGLFSLVLNGQSFAPQKIAGSAQSYDHVIGARLADVIMAPFYGFRDAVDISVFILVLGGFLNVVTKTGALEAGIQRVVKKLNGRELIVIPILMFLFSVGGSTYGMAEETIPFYTLIAITMVASGFDTIVAVGTVLLGSGSGVIGSTVNPFSTGVAMDALKGIGIQPETVTILVMGVLLWGISLGISIYFVMSYARRVKKEKGSTILSLQEQEEMMQAFGQKTTTELRFTSKHKWILSMFGSCFLIMILSLIPWQEFHVTVFQGWTSFLTGSNFGEWYFGDLAMWFFLMAVLIALVNGFTEKEMVTYFLDGTKDMLSVVMIIVVARGASVLMAKTHMDMFILDRVSVVLRHFSPILFVIAAYILYLGLSFLIPSTSGLAYVSIPIMGALTKSMGLNPSVMIMIFASGCGLVNLITPTSGVVMGGLEIAKIQYKTWIRFLIWPLVWISVLHVLFLIGSMLILK